MKFAMYIALFLSLVLMLLGIMFLFTSWPVVVRLVMFALAFLPGAAYCGIAIDLLRNWD